VKAYYGIGVGAGVEFVIGVGVGHCSRYTFITRALSSVHVSVSVYVCADR